MARFFVVLRRRHFAVLGLLRISSEKWGSLGLSLGRLFGECRRRYD